MQKQLEPILLVLAVGSAVAILAKRVGVPYNVALVLVAALLVFMHAVKRALGQARRPLERNALEQCGPARAVDRQITARGRGSLAE